MMVHTLQTLWFLARTFTIQIYEFNTGSTRFNYKCDSTYVLVFSKNIIMCSFSIKQINDGEVHYYRLVHLIVVDYMILQYFPNCCKL